MKTNLIRNKQLKNSNKDKKTFQNNTNPPIKSPTKPPIQLFEKPKNLTNNIKTNKTSKNIYNTEENRKLTNKYDKNTNIPNTKNFSKKI